MALIKINIQLGPVKMMSMEKFKVTDLLYSSSPEPGKIRVIQKILIVPNGQPEAEAGDIDFNMENCWTHDLE